MKYELLILLGIALFLIFRLRSVLGTREGFEKSPTPTVTTKKSPDFKVIEGGRTLTLPITLMRSLKWSKH